MSIVISNLPYGDRRPDLFIDTMVKSAAVLNRFRLVDGVKAKVNVPIFDATLSFGSDLCVFDGLCCYNRRKRNDCNYLQVVFPKL